MVKYLTGALEVKDKPLPDRLKFFFNYLDSDDVSAPVVDGSVEVKPGRGALYEFADEKLEKQGPIAKHLLRMGPRNTKLIQAKARELAQALELPATAARSP